MSPARHSKHPPRDRSRAPLLRFLAWFVVYSTAALVIIPRIPAVETFGIDLTVQTVTRVFALFGQKIERSGNTLVAGAESVQIVSDCSPHMPFLIFAAVVLAFPSTWRQRLIGIGFGAVAIHVFNTLRIVTLVQILIWRPDWFDFAHVYLWQTGTVLMLFAAFAMWLSWIGRGPRPAPAAPAP